MVNTSVYFLKMTPVYRCNIVLHMLDTAVWDKSCPMKMVQNAIAMVLTWSGEFSSFTRLVLSSLELGCSFIVLKPLHISTINIIIKNHRMYLFGKYNLFKDRYHLYRLETVNVYKPCLPFPRMNVLNCYKNRQHGGTTNLSLCMPFCCYI